jgi:hypothetical protein
MGAGKAGGRVRTDACRVRNIAERWPVIEYPTAPRGFFRSAFRGGPPAKIAMRVERT